MLMTNVTLVENKHRGAAFEDLDEIIAKETGKEKPNNVVSIWGPPQEVALPFVCDTRIPVEPEINSFPG